MIRTIVTPDDTHIELNLPIDYVGKKVEITCLPLDEINNGAAKITMADFWGILSDKTANEIHNQIDKSRKEWERDI